jgi:hypothetical protein
MIDLSDVPGHDLMQCADDRSGQWDECFNGKHTGPWTEDD